MRTSSWILRLAAALVGVAATFAFTPSVRAEPARVLYPEGSLSRAWVEVEFDRSVSRGARLLLVQSGASSTRAQRVRVKTTVDSSPEGSALYGEAVSRLVADRKYDVLVVAHGRTSVRFRAAFTARAPRIAFLPASAARGEVVSAQMDFASAGTRVRVGPMQALVLDPGNQNFIRFEIPTSLPREVLQATVRITTGGTSASALLSILSEPRVLTAVVDGTSIACNAKWYDPRGGRVLLWGQRMLAVHGGLANEGFTIALPVELSTLALPATFTESDGCVAYWGNDFLPEGPQGLFVSTACTVTLESLDGARLVGTFSAHLHGQPGYPPPPAVQEFDVSDGVFALDPQ